jgi:hypothetical protein
MVPTVLLLLLFLFLWGCEPRAFSDLRIVGVDRVPTSALPRAEGPRFDEGDVLKISLSGSAQWIRDVRRLEMNTYPIVVRCDDRGVELYADGPFVGRSLLSPYDDHFSNLTSSTMSAQYDLYLPERGRYSFRSDPNASAPTYDLGHERIPLCVSIAGGSMAGAYGRSNEVRLEIGHQEVR